MQADGPTAAGGGSDMVRAMRVRVVEAERTVFLTGSFGLAPTSGNDITGLLSDADTAMHAAKESGRDRFVLLDDERRAATLDRRGMLSHLRACLDAGDIVVHHQPVIDLMSGEVQGFEALVRLPAPGGERSEEHTSELQSLMRISYAVFCLTKKSNPNAQGRASRG